VIAAMIVRSSQLRSRRIEAALALVLVLSSCIGATRLYSNDVLLRSPTIDRDHPEIVRAGDDEPSLTTADVEALWGRPSSVTTEDDGTESWEYSSDDHCWSGAILASVVIPLPLAIPTSHENVQLRVQYGVVTEAKAHLQDLGMTWLGLAWDDDQSEMRFGLVAKRSLLANPHHDQIGLPWCAKATSEKHPEQESSVKSTPQIALH
jgi:hypothetical protein